MTTMGELMLKGMFPDTITVKPFLSTNSDAEDAYGTAKTYSARVERQEKKVLGPQGDVIASDFQAYLITSDTFTRGQLSFGGEVKQILKVASYADDMGTAFKVIYA